MWCNVIGYVSSSNLKISGSNCHKNILPLKNYIKCKREQNHSFTDGNQIVQINMNKVNDVD